MYLLIGASVGAAYGTIGVATAAFIMPKPKAEDMGALVLTSLLWPFVWMSLAGEAIGPHLHEKIKP